MITIFASLADGPERNYSRVGNIYQVYLNPSSIAYMIPSEQIVSLTNGTLLRVSATEFKRITLLIAPELT